MFRWLTKAFDPRKFFTTDPALARVISGGMDSPSGKLVSVDTALQLATVWACVRLISQTIATLPLQVFSEDDQGNRTLAKNHPLFGLLHDQPNADMTAVEFWEAIISCVLLWGNGYAVKAFNALGDVIALTLLAPDRMNAKRMPDGSVLYTYTPYNGQREEFTDDQLFHIKGWSLNGLLGLSPISYARASFGTALAADEAAGKFFANGLKASGFIQTGNGAVLTEAQRERFKAEMTKFMGSGNAGKTMLLEGGFTHVPLTISPEDGQLLATRQHSSAEIAAWFGVPAWMVGAGNSAARAGAGLEQEMLQFLGMTLRPWFYRIEARIRMSLIKPSDRGLIVARFNFEDLLRTDSAARAALYGAFSQNGIETRNEIRRHEGLPAVEGGDVLTVQSNLVPLDQVGQAPATQTPAGFGLPPPPQVGPAKPPEKQ